MVIIATPGLLVPGEAIQESSGALPLLDRHVPRVQEPPPWA